MQARVLLLAAVLGTWCSTAAVSSAQLDSSEPESHTDHVDEPPSAEQARVARSTPIPAVAIPVRAREVDATLQAARRLQQAPEPDRIAAALPRFREEMAHLAQVSELSRAGWRRRQLSDLAMRWLSLRVQLDAWLGLLNHRADAAEALKQATHALRQTWTVTLAVLREDRASPRAAQTRAEQVLHQLDVADALLHACADSVFTLQEALGDTEDELESKLERVRTALAHYTDRAWQRAGTPIWALVASSGAGALPPLRIHGQHIALGFRAFRSDYGARLPLDLLIFVLFLLAAVVLAKRARERAGAAGQALPEVLHTPLAAALVVSFVISSLVYSRAMFVVFDVLLLASLAPLYWLAPRLVRQPALAGPVRLLLAPLAIHRVLLLLALDSPWDELAMLLVGALFWAALYRLRQASAFARASAARSPGAEPGASTFERGLALFMRATLLGLAGALLAGLLGYAALLSYLIEGFTASAYWLLLSIVLTRVLQAFLGAVLESRRLQRLASIAQHGDLIRGRALVAVSFLGALLWCSVSLYAFGLMAPLGELLAQLLGKRAELGAWSISLGDLARFGLALYLSALAARLLGFVLEYDVLPALSLGRGVPAAISRLSRYAVLTLGFVLAVGAAGVDLSRMALLASALSVGVGFGMQELVNNFVSGLILIFARPVRVGDVVELGELTGEVRKIGIRSSTLRTYQGAEVIIPNAELISDQVINWTLSDLTRRIEVPLSLDGDVEPNHMIDVVQRAVSDIPGVERFPAPTCIVTGIGEGDVNVELRIWVKAEDWPYVRGAALLAIHESLSAEGVPAPFTEWDVHVRSIDAAAAKQLAAPWRLAASGSPDAERRDEPSAESKPQV